MKRCLYSGMRITVTQVDARRMWFRCGCRTCARMIDASSLTIQRNAVIRSGEGKMTKEDWECMALNAKGGLPPW